MVDCGIQTSPADLTKHEDTLLSTDLALSSIYNDVHFHKSTTTQANNYGSSSPAVKEAHCGNQVEEAEIVWETELEILSQIECEYNCQMLKQKKVNSLVE
jgi:hypothetical protein